MIQASNLSLRRGSKWLFDQGTFQIHPKQRVGLTGANGAGKSSLFAVFQQLLGVDAGELFVPPDWVIAQVEQQLRMDERSALDFVLDGDEPLRHWQQQLAKAEAEQDGVAIAHCHDQLSIIDGYSAEARASSLLLGLGFTQEKMQQPSNRFSGGWQMRLNLGRALMCRSDLLLLDEPTNHLDLETIVWLENWLSHYPGTLIVISHDRTFLDHTITHVLHIEHQRITLTKGNYSQFEHIRAARLANQQQTYVKQQETIAAMENYIRRFKAKASKAKQAQSRVKALERMQLVAPAHVDSPFHFQFFACDDLPSPLLKCKHLSFGYGLSVDDEIGEAEETQLIIKRATFQLYPGDRIGLLGANGAGKTTLMKLLGDELIGVRGTKQNAKSLEMGYFAQHQIEQLNDAQSPLEHLKALDNSKSDVDHRTYLGRFGFSNDQALMAIGPFSGGEKSRLALALLVYQRPNVLLLDEPTNHLDMDMRQALSMALQGFEGAMVLVSHDRHLIESTCDQLWLVHDQAVSPFEGNLDDYAQWRLSLWQASMSESVARTAPASESEKSGAMKNRQQEKRRQAQMRQQLSPLKKRIEQLEQHIAQLEEEQSELEQRLADAQLYEAEHKATLLDLLNQQAQIQTQLAQAENDWEAAEERLAKHQAILTDND